MHFGKAESMPLTFMVSTIIGVMLFFTAMNIGARTFELDVSDHDELTEFGKMLENSRPGRVNAFSSSVVSEDKVAFFAIMDSPEPFRISIDALPRDYREFLYYDYDSTRKGTRSQGQVSPNIPNIPWDFYIVDPSDCSDDSACVCVFRGAREDEDGDLLQPMRSSCESLGLDFRGDAITFLTDEESGMGESEYNDMVGDLEGDPPIYSDSDEPRTSDIKVFYTDMDNALLTIRIMRTENSFVACADRYHCERQHQEIMGGTSPGQ
ncbi:MAG: hypothetical protein ACLFTR_04555, partial [Candidatus Woesearchaeota archaeon]